jgi:hypothetical protein
MNILHALVPLKIQDAVRQYRQNRYKRAAVWRPRPDGPFPVMQMFDGPESLEAFKANGDECLSDSALAN